MTIACQECRTIVDEYPNIRGAADSVGIGQGRDTEDVLAEYMDGVHALIGHEGQA